jgi:hypothetical protein
MFPKRGGLPDELLHDIFAVPQLRKHRRGHQPALPTIETVWPTYRRSSSTTALALLRHQREVASLVHEENMARRG